MSGSPHEPEPLPPVAGITVRDSIRHTLKERHPAAHAPHLDPRHVLGAYLPNPWRVRHRLPLTSLIAARDAPTVAAIPAGHPPVQAHPTGVLVVALHRLAQQTRRRDAIVLASAATKPALSPVVPPPTVRSGVDPARRRQSQLNDQRCCNLPQCQRNRPAHRAGSHAACSQPRSPTPPRLASGRPQLTRVPRRYARAAHASAPPAWEPHRSAVRATAPSTQRCGPRPPPAPTRQAHARARPACLQSLPGTCPDQPW